MNYTRPLRTALLANAVFSAVCGLLMADDAIPQKDNKTRLALRLC